MARDQFLESCRISSSIGLELPDEMRKILGHELCAFLDARTKLINGYKAELEVKDQDTEIELF